MNSTSIKPDCPESRKKKIKKKNSLSMNLDFQHAKYLDPKYLCNKGTMITTELWKD